MTPLYVPAQAAHRPQLETLLGRVNLPTDDLPADLSEFVLAFDGDTLIGSAGLEVFGPDALLRSVAVLPDYQGQHIARHLIEQLRRQAQAQGVSTLYLITTTADRYFARLGFDRAARADVPPAIARTRQFSGLCPASAISMKQTLRNS